MTEIASQRKTKDESLKNYEYFSKMIGNCKRRKTCWDMKFQGKIAGSRWQTEINLKWWVRISRCIDMRLNVEQWEDQKKNQGIEFPFLLHPENELEETRNSQRFPWDLPPKWTTKVFGYFSAKHSDSNGKICHAWQNLSLEKERSHQSIHSNL